MDESSSDDKNQRAAGLNASECGDSHPVSPLEPLDPGRLRDMVVGKQGTGSTNSMSSPQSHQSSSPAQNPGLRTTVHSPMVNSSNYQQQYQAPSSVGSSSSNTHQQPISEASESATSFSYNTSTGYSSGCVTMADMTAYCQPQQQQKPMVASSPLRLPTPHGGGPLSHSGSMGSPSQQSMLHSTPQSPFPPPRVLSAVACTVSPSPFSSMQNPVSQQQPTYASGLHGMSSPHQPQQQQSIPPSPHQMTPPGVSPSSQMYGGSAMHRVPYMQSPASAHYSPYPAAQPPPQWISHQQNMQMQQHYAMSQQRLMGPPSGGQQRGPMARIPYPSGNLQSPAVGGQVMYIPQQNQAQMVIQQQVPQQQIARHDSKSGMTAAGVMTPQPYQQFVLPQSSVQQPQPQQPTMMMVQQPPPHQFVSPTQPPSDYSGMPAQQQSSTQTAYMIQLQQQQAVSGGVSTTAASLRYAQQQQQIAAQQHYYQQQQQQQQFRARPSGFAAMTSPMSQMVSSVGGMIMQQQPTTCALLAPGSGAAPPQQTLLPSAIGAAQTPQPLQQQLQQQPPIFPQQQQPNMASPIIGRHPSMVAMGSSGTGSVTHHPMQILASSSAVGGANGGAGGTTRIAAAVGGPQLCGAMDPQSSATALRYPPEICLAGCVFLVLDDSCGSSAGGSQQVDRAALYAVLRFHGADIEVQHPHRGGISERVTHIVTQSVANNDLLHQILTDRRKRIITLQWLNETIARKRTEAPTKACHLPTCFGDANRPAVGKIISIAGFDAAETSNLKSMIRAIGAKFTSYLSSHNHVLIAKNSNCEEIEKAKRFGTIQVVNYQWLVEIYFGNVRALNDLGNVNYSPMNQSALFETSVSTYALERVSEFCQKILYPWKLPTPLNEAIIDKAFELKKSVERDRTIFPHRQYNGLEDQSGAPSEEQIAQANEIIRAAGKEGVDPVSVHFEGFLPVQLDQLSRKARFLGATLAGSVAECSHFVVPSLEPTAKLVEALALGKNVVSPSWVQNSFSLLKLVDCLDFFVHDPDNELRYGFNLKNTVLRARHRKVFEDVTFHVSPSVTPSYAVLNHLIRAAGGTVERERPKRKHLAQRIENDDTFLVVVNESDVHLYQYLLSCNFPLFTEEFVMISIIRHDIDASPVYRLRIPYKMSLPGGAIATNAAFNGVVGGSAAASTSNSSSIPRGPSATAAATKLTVNGGGGIIAAAMAPPPSGSSGMMMVAPSTTPAAVVPSSAPLTPSMVKAGC